MARIPQRPPGITWDGTALPADLPEDLQQVAVIVRPQPQASGNGCTWKSRNAERITQNA
jgi:hypothetical protein